SNSRAILASYRQRVRRRRLSAASANTFCKPRLGSDNETAFRASPGARFGIHKSYPFIDRPRKRVASMRSPSPEYTAYHAAGREHRDALSPGSLSAPSISRRRPDGFGEGCNDDGKAKRKRSDPAEMRKLAALAMAKVKGETSSGYAEC